MRRSFGVIFGLIFATLATGCDTGNNASRGPIILGDSSTIVNEMDTQYLSDYVVDIQNQPVAEEPAQKEDTTAKPADETTTSKTADQPAPVAAPTGKGLSIPFKEVTAFIPNITTRTYRTQDPQRSNGVTYELTGGNLPGNKLQITSGTPQKVSMRYSTIIVAKRGNETLKLESLGNTTDWKEVKANSGNYPIALNANNLEVKTVSPAQIRTAVSRAARNKRLSRADITEWEKAARNAKSLSGAPFTSILRSVMWKIDGKGFSKQIRIDIPVE